MWKIQPNRQVSQIDSLWVQQFLIDRVVQREVMLFDRIPELRAVFFAQKHDRLPSPGPQVICLFYAVLEQIVKNIVLIVQPH